MSSFPCPRLIGFHPLQYKIFDLQLLPHAFVKGPSHSLLDVFNLNECLALGGFQKSRLNLDASTQPFKMKLIILNDNTITSSMITTSNINVRLKGDSLVLS